MGTEAGLWLIAFRRLQPRRPHLQGSRQMEGRTRPSAGVAATVQLPTLSGWGRLMVRLPSPLLCFPFPSLPSVLGRLGAEAGRLQSLRQL